MLGLSQLILDFTTKPAWSPLRHLRDDAPPPEPAKAVIEAKAERDAELEAQARGWLEQLDLPGMARLLSVEWNPRLRSTAVRVRLHGLRWSRWRGLANGRRPGALGPGYQ